jgi:hypothetical protein
MSTSYAVSVGHFAERHHIKDFKKKYKSAWDITWRALLKEFQAFDVLLERGIAEIITSNSRGIKICKAEFRIAGSRRSRHGSGNRCIVAVHTQPAKVIILFIYHKNHLTGHTNETDKWKNIIKRNYPEYREYL